jgi:hypothetical protein
MSAIFEIETQRSASATSETLISAEKYQCRLDRLERQFKALVLACDMNAPALIADPRKDYRTRLMRPATVGEMMHESLDYGGGPQIEEVMELLANAAFGRNVQPIAQDLLARMAEKFADHRIDEVNP